MHKYDAVWGPLLTALRQCFPSLDESGQWPRSNKAGRPFSSYFILSSHLPAVNKQAADDAQKSYLKDIYRTFNYLGAFIIKFPKQTFKFSKPRF